LNAIKTSLQYLKLGAALTLRAPVLFAQIIVMFSIPALGAALLAGTIASGGRWGVLLVILDSLTTLVGPVVFMMAVGAGYRREVTSFGQVIRRTLPWLPRYLWTNVHTSLIFWVPVGSVVLLIVNNVYFVGEAVAGALFLFSGAIFPLDVLPAWLRPIGYAIPITYWLELVRRSLIGSVAETFQTLAGFSNLQLIAILVGLTVAGLPSGVPATHVSPTTTGLMGSSGSLVESENVADMLL